MFEQLPDMDWRINGSIMSSMIPLPKNAAIPTIFSKKALEESLLAL
jgi:hypothetical protein